jgi:uncharacterized protein (DUF433 family)
MRWQVFADWQLGELQALANFDPERVETILNTLWASYPGLHQELLINALEEGRITEQDAIRTLGVSPAELAALRKSHDAAPTGMPALALVELAEGHAARLSGCRVNVWEVVREYRKLGSVDRLEDAFHGVSIAELAAALEYARLNPAEIQDQIDRYEALLEHRREQYPYTR